MPTQKPRLYVTLDPYTYALIDRLSELGGEPKGRIVASFIESARPVIQGMVDAAEEYLRLSKDAQAQKVAALEAAGERLMPDARRLQAQVLRAFEEPSGLE